MRDLTVLLLAIIVILLIVIVALVRSRNAWRITAEYFMGVADNLDDELNNRKDFQVYQEFLNDQHLLED